MYRQFSIQSTYSEAKDPKIGTFYLSKGSLLKYVMSVDTLGLMYMYLMHSSLNRNIMCKVVLFLYNFYLVLFSELVQKINNFKKYRVPRVPDTHPYMQLLDGVLYQSVDPNQPQVLLQFYVYFCSHKLTVGVMT